MKRRTLKHLIAVLFIAPAFTVVPAFADCEGPSKEDTIDWILQEAVAGRVRGTYYDGEMYHYNQQVSLDGGTIRVTLIFGDDDSPWTLSATLADLVPDVDVTFGNSSRSGQVDMLCRHGDACIVTDDPNTWINIFVAIRDGMEARAKKAFDHLICLSGGKGPVDEDLF